MIRSVEHLPRSIEPKNIFELAWIISSHGDISIPIPSRHKRGASCPLSLWHRPAFLYLAARAKERSLVGLEDSAYEYGEPRLVLDTSLSEGEQDCFIIACLLAVHPNRDPRFSYFERTMDAETQLGRNRSYPSSIVWTTGFFFSCRT